MTDSTLIFPPGFRVLDTGGNPVSGAILTFFNAGTTTPKTVYSNSTLGTSLGTSVTCDSAGYPSSAGAKVLIWTGTASYKVVCTDASANTLWTHDNIQGALNTSAFITSSASTVTYTVTALTTSGTWVVGDVTGKAFVGNPGGGAITRTLPAASTATGVPFKVRHDGTSNAITLLSQGADLIHTSGRDTARKALTLFERGDSVELVSDGVDWQAFYRSAAPQVRMFAVEDQRTAPAGSPTVGLYYLLNGAPSGAFTSTTPACAANDIVMYDGQSNYQIFRPTTDCGWIVYDKSSNILYQYQDSAWVTLAASDTVIGMARYATQAEQETGTSTTTIVTPGRQHFHPSACKAWVKFGGGVGNPIQSSYNVSSFTRTTTGTYTINFTTAFSSVNVCVVGAGKSSSANPGFMEENTASATAFGVRFRTITGSGSGLEDPTTANVAFFGDI